MEKERKREQVELNKQKREKTLRDVKEDGGRKKDFINATREEKYF